MRNTMFLLSRAIAVACALLLPPAAGLAQTAGPPQGAGVVRIGTDTQYNLSRELQYLEDPSGQLTLEDVTSAAFQPDFRPFHQKGAAYNFGLTKSAIWLKVTLAPDASAPAHWLWEVAHPNLDYVDLYVPQPGGGFWRSSAGDARPFSERPVPYKDHVMPVQLFPGLHATIYLRVASQGSLVVPVRLWKPAAFFVNGHLEYTLLSAYFGVLLSMFLYNLLLYFSIRDRAYLVYVAFAGAMAAAQISLTGLAAEFLWGDNVRWNNDGVIISISLVALFAVLFARSFLGSRDHMPRLDKVFIAIAALWIVQLPLTAVLPYYVMAHIQTSLSVASASVSALSGLVAYRQRRPGARYFLLAWGMLFLATCAYSLRNLGLLPTNFLTENSLLIGSAAEMVLLSFALADRITVTRRQRRREDAMRRAEQAKKEDAERAHAEKSRFLAAISHDLRQPMYALGLSIDGLEHARLTGPFETLVPEMRSALSSIHALLDSLLFMSRLETGKVEARFSTVDAGRLLERLRLTFEAQAQRKNLRLTVIPCVAPIRSDPVLLERIMANLVGNAIRYTESGGILVAARRRSGGVLFQVWDTGPGIADCDRETIFEEFFRVPRDNGAGAGDGGAGLGLAIVRNCARLVGCDVSVASRVGRGSCFSVLVPPGDGAAEAQSSAPMPLPAAQGPLRGMRVLVVDDDAPVRRALSASLALRGCQAVPAASLREVEKLCAQGARPDAVITDYDLGGGETGLDVVRYLRAAHGDEVAVVVLTGDTSAGTAARIRAADLPLLYKPVAPGELVAMLQGLVAGVEA